MGDSPPQGRGDRPVAQVVDHPSSETRERKGMKYRTIVYEKKGLIALVYLNRPDALNAINAQMARELDDVCERLRDEGDIRAVVLAGRNGGTFSVGTDLEEMADALGEAGSPVAALEAWRRLAGSDPWESLAALPKPTVAAISGRALGSGLELALACDIRIAAEDARFGFPEIRLGLIPGHGGTQRLPRIVGRTKATEMILTGDEIDAAEAHRVELVSRVVRSEDLLSAAKGIADKLATHAPIAVRFAREAVNEGMDMTVDQGLHLETDLSVLLQTTEDRAEGLRSFRERRAPDFKGR